MRLSAEYLRTLDRLASDAGKTPVPSCKSTSCSWRPVPTGAVVGRQGSATMIRATDLEEKLRSRLEPYNNIAVIAALLAG